ncbi:hypothetical protein [Thalassotalea ganghwensis]
MQPSLYQYLTERSRSVQQRKRMFKAMTSPFKSTALLPISLLISGSVLAFTSPLAIASNVVESLSGDESVATFTTTEAREELAACVSAQNNASWTLGLDTHSSVVDLVSIAEKKQQPIEVSSAANCDLVSGIEQANDALINYPYSESSIPEVAANLDFVARSAVQVAEGSTIDSVEFELINNAQQSTTQVGVLENGVYVANFGQLAVDGYVLVTRVTSGDETREQSASFNAVHVNLADVYQVGDVLYVALPISQGGGYLKLTDDGNGGWVVTPIDLATWQSEVGDTSPSTLYQVDLGNFTGNELVDLRLTNTSDDSIIMLERTASGYQQSLPQRRVLFIHTDVLGTPVAETDESGVVQ